MQGPLRMQTICKGVNVIGALRGRADIQDAIIHCHCHGSPVERCCSENHLRASLECHELIHGLEQDRKVNITSRAITGNRYLSPNISFFPDLQAGMQVNNLNQRINAQNLLTKHSKNLLQVRLPFFPKINTFNKFLKIKGILNKNNH